jgi:Type II CAAX prenyl endopeptidase Rce1-like
MSSAAIHQVGVLDTTKQTARDLLELFVAYTLILLTLWTSGTTQRALMLTATIWIAATAVVSRHKDDLYGLRPVGLRRSWWIVLAAGFAAAVAVAISAHMGNLHLPSGFERHPWRASAYVFWSFAQQFILQDYFLLRLRRVVPNVFVAVGSAAFLFSLAHLPNPLLTIATLVWGIAACTLFVRYRDLYSLGLAHAIFGLTIAFTVPNAVHHQMRVGLGYLTYRNDARTHSVQPEQPNGIHARVGNR